MSTSLKMFGIVLLVLGLSLIVAAQETAPEEERATPPPAGITGDDSGSSPDEVHPDARPVTGLLPLTVGTFGTEHSFLAPSFRFYEAADSNPGSVGAAADLAATTTLSANALLQQVWRQNQFTLNYTAGGSIYSGQSNLNSSFQQAHVQQSFQARRWALTLADDVTYAPQAAFGFPEMPDFGNSSFVSGTAPNQSILTSTAEQLTNTAVGQLNYSLNKQSSLTVAGNFGLQRFEGNNLVDSDQGGVQVGYNYSVNPRDSLGVGYGFDLIRFPGALTSQSLNTHIVQLAYGRRITGRLALRVSAGPQINQITSPTGVQATPVTWTAQSSLVYRFRRGEANFSYVHNMNAGAGVLTLAKVDEVQGALSTRFTRTLSGSLRAGYARNTSPQGTVAFPTPVFNTEFVSASLSRPFGHEMTGFITYAYQHQSSNNVTQCGLGLCGDLDRHVGGIGFDWHMRPLLIR